MNRFFCACLCASALSVLLQITVANGQPVTIREINPTRSNIGGNNATGGRVNRLGRATDSILYAASEFGGLFKSTDGGSSWARLDGHVPTLTSDVEASPANPDLVIATSLYDGRMISLAGINVSRDGGITWTRPPSAAPPAGFCSRARNFEQPSAFGIAFDPENAAHVFVGTNCGMAKSTDSGLTWTYINPGPDTGARDVFGVLVHHNGIIDTCGLGGHRRSTDGGLNWTGPQPGGTPLPGGFCSLAASPDESSVLFATTGTRIFETDNGGASWTTEFVNPRRQGRVPFVVINKRQGRNFDLWFGDVEIFRAGCTTPATPGPGPRCPPSSTWTVAGSGAHVDMGEVIFTNPPRINSTLCREQCTNAKTSCESECSVEHERCLSRVGEPGGPLARECLQAWRRCNADCASSFNVCNTNCSRSPEGCPFVLASDGGTYVNTVTEPIACQSPKWIQSLVTTRALWLWSLNGANIPDSRTREALYMGAQDNGGFATLDAGAATPTWVNPDSGDVSDTVADTSQVLTTICCFSPPQNRVFRRNPGMTGGGEIPNYPPGFVPRLLFPDGIVRFGTNRFAMITTTGGIFATQDIRGNPIAWTRLGTNAPTDACSLRVAGSQANPTFYALTGDCSGVRRTLWRYRGISTMGTWETVPLPPGSNGVGIFAVDPKDPDRLFASIVSGPDLRMFRSANGGIIWAADTALDNLMIGGGAFRLLVTTFAPTQLPQTYAQPTLLAFDPNNSNNIIAGAADAGIFLSRDNGLSWTTITNNSGDAANPVIPRPHWAYFDRECSQYNIYVGTQGRGAWRLTYSDSEGKTVSECQTSCDATATDCQSECSSRRDRCIADAGPGGSSRCFQEFVKCRAACIATRNACRQQCLDCPQ